MGNQTTPSRFRTFAEQKRHRAEVVEDIAAQMLFLSNNAMPGDVEITAFTGTIVDKIAHIPTGRLMEMLDKGTIDAAPYAPKVGNIIEAWKKIQADAPRPTFTEIEAANIAAGRDIDPLNVPESAPTSCRLFGKIGGWVVCNCPPHKREIKRSTVIEEPWSARLDPPCPQGGPVFWRCARGLCDLLVDASDEKAVRRISVSTTGRLGGQNEETSTAASLATAWASKQGGRLEMFVEQCGLKYASQSPEQVESLRLFCKWWDANLPGQAPKPETWEPRWEQWQFEVAA